MHPNGKAYSTHYVADNKGYRIVPHHGDILVYPKDGSDARKASFFESFNEDEIKSSNIRYFFPNGCKSTMIDIKLIDPSATPSPYVSPQFSGKADDATKTVPGEATNFNQNNKNFPTKIIPIVTGTVIQNKLNQKQGGNTLQGGTITTSSIVGGPTSESGSGSSGQVTNVNDNIKNVGNNNHDNGGSHNTDGDDNSNNDANHSNNNENKTDHHTVPIYERVTDGTSEDTSSSKIGLDNRYLPSEIEIEEPEKNEFLKIVPVTPSTPVIPVTPSTPITVAVPSKPIVPVITSNPTVTVLPTKPTVTVNPTKPTVPVPPTKPATQVTPTKPVTQVTPMKPYEPIVPVTPSPIVPITSIPTVSVTPFIPTKPTKPSLPTPTFKPVTPASPTKTIPMNPLVPVEVNNQCQDCCEDTQRPTLLMARNSEKTCCKKDVAKLSIPISMDKLAKISMTELIEITSETNTITMLKKLLALAEKYQF